MIYSCRLQREIPVQVERKEFELQNFGTFTRYVVKDNKIPVGIVDLQDTKNGVKVLFIKNENPNLYKHFGTVADQIEVEHCLNRGIKKPYIKSEAALESHVQHFLRGKRFINEGINVLLEELTKNLLKGERIFTRFLGTQPMFMPQDLVNKCMEQIKKMPLLKRI